MTNILKIPANTSAYITAIVDAATDKLDVVDFVFGYSGGGEGGILDGIWAY
jgi:hypothetical protein